MIPSYYWKIPVVGVTTTSLYPWQHDIIGNPENLAISPNNLYEVSSDFTSFWTRLTNAYYGLTSKFDYLHITHSQDEILRQHYGPNAPSVREFEKNVSLILMNSFFPINGIKPMTTGLIEVGGLHIQNEGPTLNDVISLKKYQILGLVVISARIIMIVALISILGPEELAG